MPSFKPLAQRLLVAAALVVAGSSALAVEAGQIPPYLSVDSGNGKAITLADFKGKVVYLDFWASWCGPCKQSFPFMNAMQSKYASRGFQVVGVNLDPKREDAAGFLAKVPAQFTIGYDPTGDTPKRYAIQGMPTSMLIGANGKIIAVHNGFHEDQRKDIEGQIEAALKQSGR